jgi:hypothetical protein
VEQTTFSLLVLFSFALSLKEKRIERVLGPATDGGSRNVPLTNRKAVKDSKRGAFFLHAFLTTKKRRCRSLFGMFPNNEYDSHKKKANIHNQRILIKGSKGVTPFFCVNTLRHAAGILSGQNKKWCNML